MRLLYYEDGKFQLKEFDSPPPYAILSHTWSEDNNDEVTYQDIVAGTAHEKRGYEKLLFCRDQAIKDGHEYYWIDTCCINKKDEPETSCAIRSMYRWYTGAQVCYVYLPDVSSKRRDAEGNPAWQSSFRTCRWFTRGWTLQELLAPAHVDFYARDGRLGNKQSLCSLICEVTNLPEKAVLGQNQAFDHATRLSWINSRTTKREEDLYYCLSGICEISMGARYGEGRDGARERLTRKIVKKFGFSAMSTSEATRHTAQPTALVSDAESRAQTLDRLKFDTMESRRNTIKKAQAKTCQWILSHPGYLKWLDPQALSEHHGFFWIKGKPGVGKSVLVKYIDQHITKASAKSDIRLSFYFNARGGALEKSFLGLYRSLLSQLLLTVPELQPCSDALRTISTFDDSAVSKLQDCLSTCLRQLQGRRIHCFVDALDECQEEDVHRMIEFFQELQEDATANDNVLYVIFASRHYPIVDIPDAVQLILEDAEAHRHDLSSYIDHRLRLTTPRQTKELKDAVVTRSNGIFLWVVIVVDLLSKLIRDGRMHDVHRRLAEIPEGLPQLFESILLRDKQHLNETILCLQWILYAKRPLSLPEFYFAMMAGINPSSGLELEDDTISDEQMHAYLLSTSKGLAELTKGKNPTTQFIHESVRDFLIDQAGFQIIDASGRQFGPRAHDALKHCCLATLLQKRCSGKALIANIHTSSSESKESAQQLLRRHVAEQPLPFLLYSIEHILQHADDAALEVSQGEFLDAFDLTFWSQCADALQFQIIDRYISTPDIVYVCAERNLAKLVKQLADSGKDLEVRGPQRFGIPLLAALAHKSRDVALLILQRTGASNADYIVTSMTRHAYKGRAAYDLTSDKEPWQVALRLGSDALAHYFIARDSPGGQSFVAISVAELGTAVQSGCYDIPERAMRESDSSWLLTSLRHDEVVKFAAKHPDILRLLIDRLSWIPGDHWGRILCNAVVCGKVVSVRMLLDAFFDHRPALLSAVDPHLRSTALVLASARGCVELITVLTQAGADFDIIGRQGERALWSACKAEETAAVKCLLGLGARTSTRLQGGRECLHIVLAHQVFGDMCLKRAFMGTDMEGELLQQASRKGDATIRSLLDAGASINAQDVAGHTPLFAAAEHGHTHAVRELLARGAIIDPVPPNFRSPLAAAAAKGHTLIVLLLIEAGADVNARGGRYGHPWLAAYLTSHYDIAAILLKAGALWDLSSADQLGRSILHLAAMAGSMSGIEYAIRGGRHVDEADNHGWTASHWAVYNENRECADALARLGANHKVRDWAQRSVDDLGIRASREALGRMLGARFYKEYVERDRCECCEIIIRTHQMRYECTQCKHKYWLCQRCGRDANVLHSGHEFQFLEGAT